MPRKKSRQKKPARKACNNMPKQQSRVSDYLAHRPKKSNTPIDETNATPQQSQQPKEKPPRQNVRQTRQNTAVTATPEPESEDQSMHSEQSASDNEVQFIGSQTPEPKTGRQESEEEEEDDEESTNEEQSEEEEESDQDGEKMDTEEDEQGDEEIHVTDEEVDDNDQQDSDEEISEEDESEEGNPKDGNELETEEKEDTDDDEEQEWDDDDNAASAQDAKNAKSKGQVRFAQSFKAAAETNARKPTTEIQYKQRRLIVTVNIPEVDNNVDRLSHLVTEMNEFLKFARKNNTKFRLRPFATLSDPDHNEKNQWRTRMIDNDSSDFRAYCQGYYPFSAPRGGTYRLRINAVMEKKVSLPNLIENVTHDWGHKDNRAVSDIKAQNVYDPVKIGYLMRVTRYITHSHELVEAMEEAAKRAGFPDVFFGISWGTIPSPVGGYDKDSAVQAVLIETNRDHIQDAVELIKKWYPLNPNKKASPPFPGNFRFVINRDHPSVKGNNIAISNLSVLMERQGIFNMYAQAEQTFCIKALDKLLPASTVSLRQQLLAITSKTSGADHKDKPIFMSISKSINSRTGQKSAWFTFHKSIANEAVSIVKNLPLFLKTEWEVDPEEYCYAQFLSERDQWDPVNRVANNEDTDELAKATTEYTMDLHQELPEKDKEQEDAASMTSKAAREMHRMMGEDAETVLSITKERQRKQSKQGPKQNGKTGLTAINIDASRSIGSISGISATSTKMSAVRVRLQQEFTDKFESQESQINKLMEDKTEREQQNTMLKQQMDQMTALLKSLQANMLAAAPTQATQHSRPEKSQEDSSQNSGESTTPANEVPQRNSTPEKRTDKDIPMASPSPNKDLGDRPTQTGEEEEQTIQHIHPLDLQPMNLNVLDPAYGVDEEFPPDDDGDFEIFRQQQQRKEQEAISRGEVFTPDKWYGSVPADIPLPPSASSTESELPLIRSPRSLRKRIVQTDSDDIDTEVPNQSFHSHNSDRYKKRTNATGSQPGGQT